jgi:hypothetical protein
MSLLVQISYRACIELENHTPNPPLFEYHTWQGSACYNNRIGAPPMSPDYTGCIPDPNRCRGYVCFVSLVVYSRGSVTGTIEQGGVFEWTLICVIGVWSPIVGWPEAVSCDNKLGEALTVDWMMGDGWRLVEWCEGSLGVCWEGHNLLEYIELITWRGLTCVLDGQSTAHGSVCRFY